MQAVSGDPFASHAHPDFSYEVLGSPTDNRHFVNTSGPGRTSSWLSAGNKLRRSATTRSSQIRSSAIGSTLVARLKGLKLRSRDTAVVTPSSTASATAPHSPASQPARSVDGHTQPASPGTSISPISAASQLPQTPVTPLTPVRTSSLHASRSFPPGQYAFTASRAAPTPPTAPSPVPEDTPAPGAPRAAFSPLPSRSEIDDAFDLPPFTSHRRQASDATVTCLTEPSTDTFTSGHPVRPLQLNIRNASDRRPLTHRRYASQATLSTTTEGEADQFTSSRFNRPMALDLRSNLNRRSLTFDGAAPHEEAGEVLVGPGGDHRGQMSPRSSWAERLVRRRDSSVGGTGIYRRSVSVGTMTTDHPEDDTGYAIRPHLNALGLDLGTSPRARSRMDNTCVDSVYITPFMPSPYSPLGRDHLRTSQPPRPRHIRQHTDLPVVMRMRQDRPATAMTMRALDLPPPTYDQAVSVATSTCPSSPSTPRAFFTPALSPFADPQPLLSPGPEIGGARSPESTVHPDHFGGTVGDWISATGFERAPEVREYEKLHARNT